jgi:hypothetical protein
MPLSEQEQRLLEEMERSLYHNDADYVAGAGGAHGRPTYGRVVLGILIGVVGVATMITGVIVRFPIIGVVGFVLMFVGVLLALTPPRGTLSARPSQAPEADSTPRTGSTGGKTSGGSFLQNLGERWENRSDEHDE